MEPPTLSRMKWFFAYRPVVKLGIQKWGKNVSSKTKHLWVFIMNWTVMSWIPCTNHLISKHTLSPWSVPQEWTIGFLPPRIFEPKSEQCFTACGVVLGNRASGGLPRAQCLRTQVWGKEAETQFKMASWEHQVKCVDRKYIQYWQERNLSNWILPRAQREHKISIIGIELERTWGLFALLSRIWLLTKAIPLRRAKYV